MRRRQQWDGRAAVDALPPEQCPCGAGPDDADLRDAIAGGDVVALGTFYDRHSGAAYGLAWRMVGETEAAEAVVAQAFRLLWRDLRGDRHARGSERAALLARVHACARAAVRRRALPVDLARVCGDDDRLELGTPAVDGHRSAEGQGIAEAVARLPALRRRALLLAYFGGCRNQEIADLLGIPRPQVHQELRRGLGDLRRAIGEEGS